MINQSTWLKAVALYELFQKNGEVFGRSQLVEHLGLSDRIAGYVHWALRHRQLINSEPVRINPDAGQVELAIGDIHIPYQDDIAVNACLDYADKFNPSIISIMGDMLDCYNVSSFDKNPLRSKRLFEEISVS